MPGHQMMNPGFIGGMNSLPPYLMSGGIQQPSNTHNIMNQGFNQNMYQMQTNQNNKNPNNNNIHNNNNKIHKDPFNFDM